MKKPAEFKCNYLTLKTSDQEEIKQMCIQVRTAKLG